MGRPPSRNLVAVLAALAGIALVGGALRLSGNGERTLSWDEAYHVQLVLLPSAAETLAALIANPPSDPLYALILRAWAALAGTADLAIRAPSVAFSAMTTLAAAWLACELTRSRRVAIVGAALVASSPYLVEYGQQASLYALTSLLTTVALAAGWRWLRTGTRQSALLAIALSVAAVYSHYTVIAVLASAALLSLGPWASRRIVPAGHVLAAGFVVLIAWMPWLAPMLISWAVDDYPRTALAREARPAEILAALSQYTSGSQALLSSVRPVQVLGIAAGAALVLRAWLVAGHHGWLGLRAIVVTFGALLVGSWGIQAVSGGWFFVAHLMLTILPALLVVAAAGFVAPWAVVAPGEPAWRRLDGPIVLFAGAGLLVAHVYGLALNVAVPPRDSAGSREIARMLELRVAHDEPVFVLPPEQQLVLMRYTDLALVGLPADLDLHRLYAIRDDATTFERSTQRFLAVFAGHERAWLVYTAAREADADFMEWIGQRATVTRIASERFADLYEVSPRVP